MLRLDAGCLGVTLDVGYVGATVGCRMSSCYSWIQDV